MLNLCKQKVKFNYNFSMFLNTYKCTEFSVGGGGAIPRYD